MSNCAERRTKQQYLAIKKQRKYRRKIFTDIFKKYQQVDELPDGYAFCYPRSEDWAAKLNEFLEICQSRYPFFTPELIFEPNQDAIWMRIKGPEGTKDVIKKVLSRNRKTIPTVRKAIQLGFRLATSPVRVTPDFIIIGAAKCGTTSLYGYLTQHPCIAPAFKKELYFFDRYFGRGMAWYRAYFPTLFNKKFTQHIKKRNFITGESTPCYLFHPHAPRRVFEKFPRIKLIVLLRNPVDRAYSYYHMKVRRGFETLSFEEAVEKEEERLDGELDKMIADENYFSFNRHNFSYLARGIYVDQLRNWMKFFPKEQFLIVKSEDFYKQSSEVSKQILGFLDLPEWELNIEKKYNYFPYPKMDTKIRKRLVEYFKPYNQRLYELLGMNLGWDS